MQYNWHWKVLLETEPGGTGSYLQYLIVGLGWTLATALAAWAIALVVGAVVGTLRTTRLAWAVRVGNLYVEVFRNIPLIVQMFLWFFVMPELLPKGLGDWVKQMPPPWGSYLPAVLCLGIYTSVRVAEQVRAGIALQAYIPDTARMQCVINEWARKRVAKGGSPITIRLPHLRSGLNAPCIREDSPAANKIPDIIKILMPPDST